MKKKTKIVPLLLLLLFNTPCISTKKLFALTIDQQVKKNTVLLLKGMSMFTLCQINKTLEQLYNFFKKCKKNLWIGTLSTILAITGCVPKLTKEKKVLSPIKIDQRTKQKEEHTLTVWVHGTRFETPFIREKLVKNVLYKMYIQEGLLSVADYEKRSNFKTIDYNLAKSNCHRFKPDHLYVFGWSGKLSHKARKRAAHDLHTSLLELIHNYKAKQGVIPHIRLITHSHGGNVTLNFAKINDSSQEKITIKELILLACPVQKRTAHLLASNTFKKIYSIYSSIDMIQIADPQGLHQLKKTIKEKIKKPFFSQRRFRPQKNLYQVKIKINRRGIGHLEFLLSRFTRTLPYLLQEIDAWIQLEANDPEVHKKNRLLKVSTWGGLKFARKILK